MGEIGRILDLDSFSAVGSDGFGVGVSNEEMVTGAGVATDLVRGVTGAVDATSGWPVEAIERRGTDSAGGLLFTSLPSNLALKFNILAAAGVRMKEPSGARYTFKSDSSCSARQVLAVCFHHSSPAGAIFHGKKASSGFFADSLPFAVFSVIPPGEDKASFFLAS
mmetsp:Transcript_30355/g.42014  ORF Transcript_30355/g.42014 Transcript_30355/m.42014 type:complete len:165 (-) Transcript_30355:832-1326(-)